MDLERSTKASGCLKNPKFLIFDGKQHPENFWFRGVTVFSANTPVFLSNSRQILTFQKPLLLHMCPVMSWSCRGNTMAQFLMLL